MPSSCVQRCSVPSAGQDDGYRRVATGARAVAELAVGAFAPAVDGCVVEQGAGVPLS